MRRNSFRREKTRLRSEEEEEGFREQGVSRRETERSAEEEGGEWSSVRGGG